MEKMNYRSKCPLSSWLDLFGDKWTLLILRDITLFQKRNFKDFMASEERIATNILADRLKLLTELGILSKKKDPKNKLLINYSITEKGLALSPIVKEMAKWSNTYIPGTHKALDI